MCNKEDLVSYLYDELDATSRAAFERHLRDCLECRDELTSMRAVRTDLLQWSPPEPDFAFRIVNGPAQTMNQPTVLRPDVASWRARLTPALGLAAAAVLVLAAAAGLAHIEVRNGPDGFTVRTGWSAAPAATLADSGRRAAARDVRLPSAQTDLAALEQRISALEAGSRDTGAGSVRNASMVSARAADAEILKVVRELLAQSETRQKGELALRIAQVIRDVDAQRVADLNRVQQGMVRIDANVTEEAKAHGELMNYILSKQK